MPNRPVPVRNGEDIELSILTIYWQLKHGVNLTPTTPFVPIVCLMLAYSNVQTALVVIYFVQSVCWVPIHFFHCIDYWYECQ